MKLGTPYRHLMPSLPLAAKIDLKSDIAANGQDSAIAITEDRDILDGHHRYDACVELGIEPRVAVIEGLRSDMEKQAWILRVNMNRRSLTAGEKRATAEKQKSIALALLADGHNQSEVARMIGRPRETIRDWSRGGGPPPTSQPTTIVQVEELDVRRPAHTEGDVSTSKPTRTEQKLSAVAMALEGTPKTEIAKKLGVPRQTVQGWIAAPEAPVVEAAPSAIGRPRKVSDDEVRRLWDEGNDRSTIAEKLDVGVGAVSAAFGRLGIGRGGRRKDPLLNQIERAQCDADLWSSIGDHVIAAALGASPESAKKLSVELGRLSKVTAQLKRRLEDVAGKRTTNGKEEVREAQGSRHQH